jgi:hypothetical protein
VDERGELSLEEGLGASLRSDVCTVTGKLGLSFTAQDLGDEGLECCTGKESTVKVEMVSQEFGHIPKGFLCLNQILAKFAPSWYL